MAIVSIKIPQLGEGLQEARLVELLKQPGDEVKKDEAIYEIETDKAVTEIESPSAGTIVSWNVEIDSVLPIGAEIGSMEVAEPGQSNAPSDSPVSQSAENANSAAEPSAPLTAPTASPRSTTSPSVNTAADGKPIPPRTRRLLREKGIAHLADQIPAVGRRLTPEDVEAFLASQNAVPTSSAAVVSKSCATQVVKSTVDYEERPLHSSQKTLNFRMARGAQQVLPATLEADFDWTAIYNARRQVAESGGPTGFAMLAWCAARAMAEFPAFRSTLSGDGETLRTYKHVNLGIAVSLDDDLLATAVVRKADTLHRDAFFEDMSARIADARAGKDQVDASTTVSISNIGKAGMRCGVPVVVTPAVATIVVGTIRDVPVPLDRGFEFRKMVTVTMSFDHRLSNGVGAANFLNAIRERAENFALGEPTTHS